ncbi:MAG TPA: hypothetical protein DDX92_12280 [Flavobacteriales bacterium]|jgi:AraC-like DNA-binding protein|nr:hypothetical protein [Flavobacteriales bacterium]
MKYQIHIDRDFGWFIGKFDNNQKHRHYAIQLSIPLGRPMIIKTSKITIKSDKPILIKPNVVHQVSSDSNHFLLLVNPASSIGHFWNQLSNFEIQELNHVPATEMKSILMEGHKNELLISALNSVINEYNCFCSSAIHKGDERINRALAYLSANSEQIVPVEEVANHCHLSSSRFLHLFKEQTGITYRRAQQWNKLTKSISSFGKMSLTEIAHQNGFSDSAHFSRTFKENFGFSPRVFLKISHFIQV